MPCPGPQKWPCRSDLKPALSTRSETIVSAMTGKANRKIERKAPIISGTPVPPLTNHTARLLIYILLRLQLLHQPINIRLLVVRSPCQRHFHLFCGVIHLALRAVHSSQARMYEPLVGMLLRVFPE